MSGAEVDQPFVHLSIHSCIHSVAVSHPWWDYIECWVLSMNITDMLTSLAMEIEDHKQIIS